MAVFKIKLTRKKPTSVLYLQLSKSGTKFSLTYDPTHDYYLLKNDTVFYTRAEIDKYLGDGWTLLSHEE